MFGFAIFLCVLLFFSYGLMRGSWLEAILSSITLAMAIIPEELPVILIVFLALGAWRLSLRNVLTRQIKAVESLGAVSVLCVDKTGTITQNIMAVYMLFDGHDMCVLDKQSQTIADNYHELIEYGILASKKDPFDPMEKALSKLGLQTLANTEHLHNDWSLIKEYPLSPELLALSQVWLDSSGKTYLIATKGAPEAIMDLCHLNQEQQAQLTKKVQEIARSGLRVIAVAKSSYTDKTLPKSQHEFDFEFVGLIGLKDPIRVNIQQAINECYQAGIRVIMLTGDYPSTAQHIAQEIGLKNPQLVLNGKDLALFSKEKLQLEVAQVNVFARIMPEQKLLIVESLKLNNATVVMTGDGVNDAPALKAANVGIAMGERGTDVAREAADIVLLKDDFSSIVHAIYLGRRIYDNPRNVS